MATYVVGDLQGCFSPLMRLMDQLKFDPAFDRVWFAGDLVSRGPQSLQTLRYAKSLGQSSISVLGNHDISLIAAAHGVITPHKSLTPLLNAPDFAELLDWVSHRPLLHTDETLNAVMVHAGIPPAWNLETAQACARDAETQLQKTNPGQWLTAIYNDKSTEWNPKANAIDRQCYTVNALTRMRYCNSQGRLELKQKQSPETVCVSHPELIPWFRHPRRQKISHAIYFGHWSTLGYHHQNNVTALDTGCVWGGKITAIRIDSDKKTRYQVTCTEYGR
ncbi:MAG: Bis(5'-nucleosyl)-tetraphosphatase, symmetrical (EC [uncultured Thiotrichaceae bacterium]|uniref:bis(5'-nucleosyl)-tetraphosphatase (symmetrical) n=1 Tax=uncultured Thiotrichaceae bacterium TaxID=298394 RepID=A0A6S6S504_9GAMM|nr:MAG: Bis(5'-nucleosyl)-tetraphosphatase, symmetrical (EC [uncultured Thiotrichaceae bacterium]